MSGDALHAHLRLLEQRCPHLRRALNDVGMPDPRSHTPGFGTLVRIIIDQQVSVMAGAAIWAKLAKACHGRVTPPRVLALGEPGLRACGFSGAKARYALGVAEAVTAKRLDFKRLHAANDSVAREMLTALKGIGPWSADIYLMFALGRTDIWPVADLALQHGVRLLHGLAERPSQAEMEKIAEIWRPYRSGAAILLWRYDSATLKKNAAANAAKEKPARKKAAKKKAAAKKAGPKRPARRRARSR